MERKNLKHDRIALVVDILDPLCCHQPLMILYRPQQEKIYLFISEAFFGIRGDTVKKPVSVDVSFKSEPTGFRSIASTFRLEREEGLDILQRADGDFSIWPPFSTNPPMRDGLRLIRVLGIVST